MKTVGVRELRQRASAVLREVEGGEAFEVTDRGRPVALLTPLPRQGGLEQLRAEGEVTPATARLADLPPALELTSRARPSHTLAALRKHER